MCGLLVSVQNVEEAQLACKHEIAVLDVKNPNGGALGAADSRVLEEIVASNVGPAIPKSFSAGELADWIQGSSSPKYLSNTSDPNLFPRFGHVKVGLASMLKVKADWRQEWDRFFKTAYSNCVAVAVSYFDFQLCDAPSPKEVVAAAAEADFCDTILFDTFHKTGNLFQHVSEEELNEMVSFCKSQSLRTVVAGSVDLDCAASVVKAKPDLIGVRGAVCDNSRTGSINSKRIKRLIDSIAKAS